MKLITAIVRPEKLDAIREGLEAYGVQGLTVSAASGYGRQRGYTEVYRGAEYNVDLLPKIRVEVLATDEQADDILDVIIASSNTGRAGDGKVWTVDVFEAVRVRTGERGVAAISPPAASPTQQKGRSPTGDRPFLHVGTVRGGQPNGARGRRSPPGIPPSEPSLLPRRPARAPRSASTPPRCHP